MNPKSSIWLILAAALLAAAPCAAAPVASGSDLSRARENVRISEEAAARIRQRLDELRMDPTASLEELATYEEYLARIEAQLEEQKRRLQVLQPRAAGSGSGKTRARSATAGRRPDVRVTPVMTEQDDVRALDSRLDESLSAFDEKLLQEVETVTDQAAASGSGGGGDRDGEMMGSTGSGQEGGQGQQGAGGASQSGSSGQKTASRSGAETGAGKERGEQMETASREKGLGVRSGEYSSPGNGAPGSGRAPADIPDGSDDDIVARQIREAAERETDPELRKKLWEEYRRYKSGAS